MKAIWRDVYGHPELLQVRELEKPSPGPGEVLVRVRASSVNAFDWHIFAGTPLLLRLSVGLTRPKDHRLGSDFAGVVESTGDGVTAFKPGDRVFGTKRGALAEYVVVGESGSICGLPDGTDLAEAAAIALAGATAYQAVVDHGHAGPGMKVLVNGASGGVGTFALQVAKALGAEVTAVCSTANVDTARSLGADLVVDYRKDDFTRLDRRHDLMIDVAGGRTFKDCARVLAAGALVVVVGGPDDNPLIGPYRHAIGMRLGAMRARRRYDNFTASVDQATLRSLAGLVAEGKLKPVIERRYPLEKAGEALAYLGQGHARGKVLVDLPDGG